MRLFEEKEVLLDSNTYEIRSQISPSSFTDFQAFLSTGQVTVTRKNRADLQALAMELGYAALLNALVKPVSTLTILRILGGLVVLFLAFIFFPGHRPEGPDPCANAPDARGCYKKFADAGNGRCQFEYAVRADNQTEATLYFKKAADKGHPEAAFRYAQALKYGEGVPLSLIGCAHYMRIAAEGRVLSAEYAWAVMLIQGQGTNRDTAAGARFLKRAADRGLPRAQYDWGYALYYGHVEQKNRTLAGEYFRRALAGGHRPARYFAARCSAVGPDARSMKNRALAGDPEAQFAYAVQKEDGDGRKEDIERAALFFQRSADRGNPDAQNQFGLLAQHGTGTNKNLTTAAHYFRRAAKQGYIDAMENTALSFEYGYGVTKNRFKAAKWYKRAADFGNSNAQFNFAQCLESGFGVHKNLTGALAYFRMADEQANPLAYEGFVRVFDAILKEKESENVTDNEPAEESQKISDRKGANGKGKEL